MRKKLKTVVLIYATAIIAVLGIYTFVNYNRLETYRLASKYSSNRAFEETVYAVDQMSQALKKGVYAADGSMCSRICSQVYANALAAESAMATLPFSTQELEQISAFLNIAGDYTYSLCSQAAEKGFSQDQVETLKEMSETATKLTEVLHQIQSSVNSGDVLIDSSEDGSRNVGTDGNAKKLSAELLKHEATFAQEKAPEYDGKYTALAKEEPGNMTEDEVLRQAAEYLGAEPQELKLEHEYSGTDSRRCYSIGDTLIFVSSSGIESFSQNRLVSQSYIDQGQAEQIASDYLKERGFENLQMTELLSEGALLHMKFSSVEDDAVCLDNTIKISVALDDGSVYSFNGENYTEEKSGAEWKISQNEAAAKLPAGLKLLESRKVILKSAGGKNVACYELRCREQENQVIIYVDAESGRQYDIVI